MAVRSQKRTRGGRLRSRAAWLACWLAAGLAAAGGIWSREAEAQKPSRDDVQAAYVYNFGKFVRWPERAGHGAIVVCVAGQDPFEQTIGKLATGGQIDGRALEIRNLERPERVGACSILFVGAAELAHGYLAAAADKPILTVGDAPDFLARGGMIQFVLVEDHVRFSVNLDAANHCGVELSSELLKVAVSVTGKPGTGGAN
jgi:hypothetical protein